MKNKNKEESVKDKHCDHFHKEDGHEHDEKR
jgi:hypothetical protein